MMYIIITLHILVVTIRGYIERISRTIHYPKYMKYIKKPKYFQVDILVSYEMRGSFVRKFRENY